MTTTGKVIGNAHPHFKRVLQRDWERPNRGEWVATLNQFVEQSRDPVVLVAHSYGCACVAHWAGSVSHANVRAAFLVAPADVDYATHTPEAVRF